MAKRQTKEQFVCDLQQEVKENSIKNKERFLKVQATLSETTTFGILKTNGKDKRDL